MNRLRLHDIILSVVLWLLMSTVILASALADKNDLPVNRKKPVKIDFNDVVEPNPADHDSANPVVIRIAVAAMISPKYTYTYYLDLLNLIGHLMDRQVQFIQRKTYAEVNDMIQDKKIDIAFICSGPYVAGKKDFGLEILAIPICHGKRVYQSYFIASKSNPIRSFDDFEGKTFAFTDPLSNTGYLVPVYYLAKRNKTPQTFFQKTFFTHSHDNSIQAVANALADGAAVDSLIYDFIQAKHPEITDKTRIVEKSPPYGIPPVVVSPLMDIDMKVKLKKIFFTIHEYPQGQSILEKLQIDRFVEGNDSDYDTVRELQNYIKTTMENNQ